MNNDSTIQDSVDVAKGSPFDDMGIPDIGGRELTLRDAIQAIKWFLEHSETNRGDEPMAENRGASWDEINSYWIQNEDRARAMVDQWEKTSSR